MGKYLTVKQWEKEMEKRGNSETELRFENGKTLMVLPGSDSPVSYDGRYDNKIGLEKIANLSEGQSIFIED